MPPETAASDLDLPIYALQRPDRPDNPMPTSAESDGRFGANPVQNRSLGSSESSSYGRVKPSKYANAGFTAPENSNTEEHEQNASASVKKNSLSPTPSPDDGVEPSTSQITAEDSVQIVRDFISLWNKRYFHPRNIEAILVPLPNSSGPEFAVNLAMRFPWAPTHPDSEPLYGIPPDTNTSRLPVETASEIGPSGSFTTADDSPNSPSATHVPDRRSTQS
ncbi:hypothetical protein C8R43DRAFT_265849 [Mycena crocata]|nr:hypothetical protein C8R43DRAFT_265849 [Mycena crocata]